MNVHARNKGVRAEREVFLALQAAGGVVLNLEGQGDHHVELDDVIYHVEVKRREKIEIEAWCRQAESEKARDFYVPVVVWRRSRQPWRATLLLDDFLQVVQ